MEFNSKLKIHVIYHYLEGDWEKAISRHLLAGAVGSRSGSQGAIVLHSFVAAAPLTAAPRGPCAASFHQKRSPIIADKWGGCQGTGSATSKGASHLHFQESS